MNKKKIFNDPVYGFVTIPSDLIYDIIQHPYFQRLRRIKQLGLSDLIYPGALHTRFHHAIGAMHLMQEAIGILREKGHMIFDAEYEASLIAILLHDIGHGPFSHSLEFSLFQNVAHEHITRWTLRRLNKEFDGRLDMAIEIFEGTYPRKFLTQLVSSQLDMDRLDYLQRDCFFTGVQEGTIGAERIIQMLSVHQDQLVVEEKGIYSIESFLNARRIMYWQVYLHKTAIGAEKMLIELIRRAKYLTQHGIDVTASPAFSIFLERDITLKDFEEDPDILQIFMAMDDTDILGSIKFWLDHDDRILSELSRRLLDRDLFRVRLLNDKIPSEKIKEIRKKVGLQYDLSEKDVKYFVTHGSVSNAAYVPLDQTINILNKDFSVVDISKAVDLPNVKAMSKIVKKHYLCWPKDVPLTI